MLLLFSCFYLFYIAQLSKVCSMCSTRHFIGNKKGARLQIGEDLLCLGKGLLWGHFAAPPHSPKSLVLWTPIKPINVQKYYFHFHLRTSTCGSTVGQVSIFYMNFTFCHTYYTLFRIVRTFLILAFPPN